MFCVNYKSVLKLYFAMDNSYFMKRITCGKRPAYYLL